MWYNYVIDLKGGEVMKLCLLGEGDNGYKFYSMYIDSNNTMYFYVFNGKTYLLDIQQKTLISIADNSVISPSHSHNLKLKPETTNYIFKVDSTGIGIDINNNNNKAMINQVVNIK